MAAHVTTLTPAPPMGAQIDPMYRQVVISWLMRVDSNDTIDYTRPFIWPSLKNIYPLFFFLHACVIVVGTVSNIALLVALFRRWKNTRRHQRNHPMLLLLANLAVTDLIKSAIVLPITVANLTMANWLFGRAMCSVLPMMHSLPVHVSLLTHVVIAVDRYRMIVTAPMRSRVPARACAVGTWLIAGAVVLPYLAYVKYIDLGATLGDRFTGVGICCINHHRHVEQYIRAAFVTMYCLPLAVIAFLYVRISVELKATSSSRQNPTTPISMSVDRAPYRMESAWLPELSSNDTKETSMPEMDFSADNTAPAWRRFGDSLDYDSAQDIDVRREIRTQRYVICMVVLFALCWFPLNVMMLATHFVYETNNNSGHFDITYLLLTLFGYMSTCVNSLVFASWRMPQQTRDRLRGYLRFSNRSSLASSITHVHVRDEPDTHGNTLIVPGTRFTNL